jgi:hypothetical protein
MKMLTTLFNAILRTGIFPAQWKVAQIIVIPKPGKTTEEITSYRPISLLPIMSKLFEKILLHKLKPILSYRTEIDPGPSVRLQTGTRHKRTSSQSCK